MLDQTPVPLLYSAACDDVNTVAGFAIWVQDRGNIHLSSLQKAREISGPDPVGYGV